MQKRLKREYHEKNNSNTKPKTRDFSKDKCNKCKLLGHWARDCPTTNTVATADTQENQTTSDACYNSETQDWMEADAINSIAYLAYNPNEKTYEPSVDPLDEPSYESYDINYPGLEVNCLCPSPQVESAPLN